MFDDLEVMIRGQNTGPPNSVSGPKTTKVSHGLQRKGSASQIVPINDLDDLEDYTFE